MNIFHGVNMNVNIWINGLNEKKEFNYAGDIVNDTQVLPV